eukprot:TRINITY_DN38584_c0_g1_i1.p1 TRINITY_DN38584_c0_g1~~TRINITY_DN38584_c0_g1_i1.p1  ORF type:complete len:109 (-),score=13.53 TRINITY_DN38584_c0_g1_i1:334-660(-)
MLQQMSYFVTDDKGHTSHSTGRSSWSFYLGAAVSFNHPVVEEGDVPRFGPSHDMPGVDVSPMDTPSESRADGLRDELDFSSGIWVLLPDVAYHRGLRGLTAELSRPTT